jgi:serine/threonine-protein kinase
MSDEDSIDASSADEVDPLLRRVAAAPPQRPPERVQQRVGTVVGRYRIDGILGVGGMAVVYQATHVNNGARRAIKMLLPEHSANEDIRRRFRREGRLAIQVDHPGVVMVIDDDVTDDDAAFLVLELLKGTPCQDLATKAGGRIPLPAACCIALQVLEVLQAAHKRAIVHRDIKPANLFVLADGTVKVLDFGIASVRLTLRDGALQTQSGAVLGTPAFMAPEQAFSSGGDIDARADLWAVGATLSTLLTGTLVARPTPVPLAKQAPEMAKAIVRVIDRALEFDRDRRWPSAGAMHAALVEACREIFGAAPERRVLAQFVEETSKGRNTQALPESEGGAKAAAGAAPSAIEPAAPLGSGASPPAFTVAPSDGPPRSPSVFRASARKIGIVVAGASTVLAAAWFLAAPWQEPPRRAPPPVTPPPTPPASSYDLPPNVPQLLATSHARRPPNPEGALPRSCAEGDDGVDGPLTIDPDGPGPIRPFEVYCARSHGSGSRREYVVLRHGPWSDEPEANTTRYVRVGSDCDCPDLVRTFTKVAINPRTMEVDLDDGSFATYDRPLACEHAHPAQCGEGQELKWGGAGGCGGEAVGRASIDLRDTPLSLAPEVRFVRSGFEARGEATISADRKTATVAGGGRCGVMVPESAIRLTTGP